MDIEKIKLEENENNDKKLIELIKEKEIEINEYKKKLKLAKEEISKLKKELNNSTNFDLNVENIKELEEENKENIPTLVLGETKIEYEDNNDFENNTVEEKYSFFLGDEIEKIEEVKENNLEDNLEDANKRIQALLNDINSLKVPNVDNCKLEDNNSKSTTFYSNDDLLDSNNEMDLIDSSDESIDNDLFENLKVAFIDNNDYECIKILNDIIESIDSIENSLTYEKSIVLIYLGYFYEKLEELLNKSNSIKNCYLSETDEVKLLKDIIEEKECPIYTEVREFVYIKTKNNKKLFRTVDTIIKVRIIDKINSILYKNFDFVYSINDIEYGEETVNIKAWVKEKNGFMWRLVEGIYSEKKEKLYMLDSSIYILKLNSDESIKESQREENYKNFFKESSIKVKNIVTKNENKREVIIKGKEGSSEEVNKEKQNSDTIVNKKIILEDQNDEVKSNNKWFNFKEKISLKLKKGDNK